MPNLENLRKQAKQYLRWHRERHHPVAAIIRAALPRFRHLNDGEVLDAPFSLADAQALVARQNGFPDWPALRTGAPTMHSTTENMPQGPILSGAEPVLYVTDFAASLAFFTEKLGFSVDFAYGDPPFYGVVARDRARLCLRLVREPVFLGDIRRREDLLSASITLDSAAAIKTLFLTYQAAGVTFHSTLMTQPWGARTFILLDPDGNLILFAAPGE
ncbi:VOC family protein [Shinella granuli]|uniref:Putative glyoxalase superfamily protein PhnB n=1 Tax=Shinella granuli TaxID=323621 RepID=A0A4R2D294_SHIGR|nr:VOC family protein [Shinella granuli]TCN47756.1 putative glyoxalase superfamily protein PhnB [Shinella granuli]